ncbi:GNAT family N-acetyltransferase [Desnuesiella massiliensis]|uniref:GNAT family N-acetyltransferase n=1 Tax=Desnuesiella massiliensis TaxID=1650662 RepID=UPI0006E31E61|nr:GNAT family N-acetyltransferase [Desnuesiella massiliensis]
MYQAVSYEKDDFYVTTDFKNIDIDAVCLLLSKSYWASSRPRDVIIKSLENSLCFSLFHKDKQIGFIRVITDCATFAYLCDVIIDENYRSNGLGKWFVECMFKHPDLQNLRRWCLITRDAQEFYKKFGFNSLSNPERYMEIFNG